MKACCEVFGVPLDLCLSKDDIPSDNFLIKSRASKSHGHELLKVIEDCYSKSISPDVH